MLSAAATILFLVIRGAQATISLGLSLSGPASVTDVDDLIVAATFTNTGDEALKLYKDPTTALSPFPADKFAISTADDTVPEFIGADPFYTFETATSFVELAPGATTVVKHQISAAYKFTVAGEYQVNAANAFNYRDDSGTPNSIDADISGTYSFKIQGNLNSSIVSKRVLSLAKRATYDSCNSWRTSKIDDAVTNTMRYLRNVGIYLTRQTATATRYVLWWGTYTEDRKNYVLSLYTNMTNSDPWSYTYYCTCDDDYYAYVYRAELGHMYFCNAFWNAPTAGTNSKAGVIIHEASHFTSIGETQDYAFGMAKSKALANTDPVKAIMNADNYEYFAETMWDIISA